MSARTRLRIAAIAFVVIGAIGSVGTATMLAPDWRAAHGGGVTGTFTLTEPMSCDRREPPRQRCGWFGDFRGDDGRTVRRDMELADGLPPGAAVGDTLAARDTGSRTQIYPVDDVRTWRTSAAFFAGFTGAFLIGLLLLEPWRWRRRSNGGLGSVRAPE
ncbi:hypothetical protein GCM10010168_64350 [Actinoplanes ianthinogenes]|uniref:DUF3592 domain-containing protein n=2 Tax=Actinoplanes ianthinogenes TaxID=122358 RepID=A0ABN6CTM2_9ACTN|nr:hypothetical protein Aiant_91570 [Actinoplanes ianthinogenes]GGR36962.1 hypothetical protein GCM10010168_64350 [Actinoplanes ianthinogenes]